ncbi:MAG: SPOR domain-containing protein [Limnohabitans sp.]|nr:SPOR domain-containing protein [Limnohabitans sp.]
MAFFKPRKNSQSEDNASELTETPTIAALRLRARQRLIGASVLVLIAIIGFPLLFDTQPRQVALDIKINMPDKDKVKAETPVQPIAPSTPVAPLSSTVADTPVATTEKATPKPEPIEEILPPRKEEKPATDNKEAAPRFIVQVGAYAEESKVHDVRSKLEKAGFKTYTLVTETKEGKRTRVRIGPFDNKYEAQKTIDKIKGLQLQAVILTI